MKKLVAKVTLSNNSLPLLNGLILSGGRSVRMGKDKALINYHGSTQLDHLTHLLKPYCCQAFVSAKNKSDYADHSVIEDRYGFNTPLNGIISALTRYPKNAWLIIACDMPYIDTQSIEYLISNRSSDNLATCYTNEANLIEPLFSIWEPESFEKLLKFKSDGGLSPLKFLSSNVVSAIKPLDFDVVTNVNTQEEFKETKKNYNV